MLSRLQRRIRAIFRKGAVDREMDEELRYHLEREIDRKMKAGALREAARREALRDFGGYDQARELCREARRVNAMENLIRDLSYGLRRLRGNPSFSAVAILSLALGIGACTAIFSVVDSVMLRSLPYPAANRLVEFKEVNSNGTAIEVADPNFRDVQAGNHCFEAFAEYTQWIVTVAGGQQTERCRVGIVSSQFFDVMKTAPFLGNSFGPGTASTGQDAVAVVSYGFWQRALGGNRNFGGVTLVASGIPLSVIGVMPAGFNYPKDTDVWAPRSLLPDETSRTAHNWQAIGRLAPGASLGQARAEMTGLAHHLKEANGNEMDATDFALIPLREYIVGDAGQVLGILSAAVAFLLLVACTNVANLLLAQTSARQKEFGVRAALGASNRRLAFQVITENMLIAAVGGALGALLAAFGVKILIGLNKAALPRADEIGINAAALIFTILLSLLAALALGLVAMVRLAGNNLLSDLKDSGRGEPAAVRGGRLRGLFTVSQISFTMILLTGAGLLGGSFYQLLQVDPGFKVQHVIAVHLSQPGGGDKGDDSEAIDKFFNELKRGHKPAPPPFNQPLQQRTALVYQQLLDRIEQVPGISAEGMISSLPLSDFGPNGTFYVDNNIALRGYADYRTATGGYFTAMGIPLLRGRLFGAADGAGSPPVAVISQSLAKIQWPNEDPIGKQIQFGNMDGDVRLIQIVGVVGDVHHRGVDLGISPTLYANAIQRPSRLTFSIAVRSEGDAGATIAELRSIVHDVNPDLAAEFQALQDIYSSSLDPRRFSMVIFVVFAGVALTLAAIGIYGVVSYSVTQRRHEIGVRMALGAKAGDVQRMILRQGLALTVIGIVIGTAAAAGLSRLMTSLLYGVQPGNRMTFAASALLLAIVALLSCYIPGRRATRMDPVAALRDQ